MCYGSSYCFIISIVSVVAYRYPSQIGFICGVLFVGEIHLSRLCDINSKRKLQNYLYYVCVRFTNTFSAQISTNLGMQTPHDMKQRLTIGYSIWPHPFLLSSQSKNSYSALAKHSLGRVLSWFKTYHHARFQRNPSTGWDKHIQQTERQTHRHLFIYIYIYIYIGNRRCVG